MNTIASQGQLEFLVYAKGVYGLKWPSPGCQSDDYIGAQHPTFHYVLRPDRISEDQNYGRSRALHTLPRNSGVLRRCFEYDMARDPCELMVARAQLRIDGRLTDALRTWLRKHSAKLAEPPKPETCRDFARNFDAEIPF